MLDIVVDAKLTGPFYLIDRISADCINEAVIFVKTKRPFSIVIASAFCPDTGLITRDFFVNS